MDAVHGQQYNNLFLPFNLDHLQRGENNGRVGIKKAHPINSDELIIFCGEAF
jgi:hypothetical protein